MKWTKMRTIDSDKLFNEMIEKGWTVTTLSKKIGAGSSYMSHVLSSGRISAQYLVKICEVLHISQADVLTDKEPEPVQIELPLNEIEFEKEDQEPIDNPDKRFEIMLSKIAAAMQEYVTGGAE